MNEQEMVNRSLYLPSELSSAIDRLAKADSRTFNNFVRLVLENYVASTRPTADPESNTELGQLAAS